MYKIDIMNIVISEMEHIKDDSNLQNLASREISCCLQSN